MKKNKLLLVTALFAMSSALFACNQNQNESSDSSAPSSINDSSSKETSSSIESNPSSTESVSSAVTSSSSEEKKTEEELFLIWKEGRDITFKRKDNYSVLEKVDYYSENVLDFKRTIAESRGGNRYFLKSIEETLDEESGSFITSDQSIICIKEVDDNGKTRTKHYEEYLDEGEIVKQGTYVSPSYAENAIQYEPKECFDGIYIDSEGNTYSSFIENFKAQWLNGEGTGEFESLKFTENVDNSVAFSFAINYTYVDDYQQKNDSDYSISVCRDQVDIVAVASGIRSVSYIMDEKTKYQTKGDENSKTILTYSIDYAFDENTYNTISVDTETTENTYFGTANFYLDGYRIERNYEACLVDEFYTLDAAKTFLDDSYSFLITGSDVETRTDLFDLFLDEEFTQPFEGQTMTENLDLYIRLNTEKGAYVEAWFKVKGTKTDETTGKETSFFYNKIKLVYHMTVGETFNKNGQIFEEYAVLEVDGEAVEEGYRPIFVCEEARVYKVLFDAGDTWM